MSELSTKDVAERIGVSVSTVKNWAARLPVPSHLDSQGNRRFPEADALPIFEAIKDLRDEQRGYETIRRVLEPAPGVSQAEDRPDDLELDQRQAGDKPEPGVSQAPDMAAIVAAVTEAIATQTEQAEKYARATYEIGELRERVRGLEGERDRLARELDEARQRIALIEAPKEEPAPRPWWKLWG